LLFSCPRVVSRSLLLLCASVLTSTRLLGAGLKYHHHRLLRLGRPPPSRSALVYGDDGPHRLRRDRLIGSSASSVGRTRLAVSARPDHRRPRLHVVVGDRSTCGKKPRRVTGSADARDRGFFHVGRHESRRRSRHPACWDGVPGRRRISGPGRSPVSGRFPRDRNFRGARTAEREAHARVLVVSHAAFSSCGLSAGQLARRSGALMYYLIVYARSLSRVGGGVPPSSAARERSSRTCHDRQPRRLRLSVRSSASQWCSPLRLRSRRSGGGFVAKFYVLSAAISPRLGLARYRLRGVATLVSLFYPRYRARDLHASERGARPRHGCGAHRRARAAARRGRARARRVGRLALRPRKRRWGSTAYRPARSTRSRLSDVFSTDLRRASRLVVPERSGSWRTRFQCSDRIVPLHRGE